MYTINYPAPALGTILSHFPASRPLVVRDMSADADDEMLSQMHIRARVSSGDYLATIATELDTLAQSLSDTEAPEAPELERVVAELLYVNTNYRISKR